MHWTVLLLNNFCPIFMKFVTLCFIILFLKLYEIGPFMKGGFVFQNCCLKEPQNLVALWVWQVEHIVGHQEHLNGFFDVFSNFNGNYICIINLSVFISEDQKSRSRFSFAGEIDIHHLKQITFLINNVLQTLSW